MTFRFPYSFIKVAFISFGHWAFSVVPLVELQAGKKRSKLLGTELVWHLEKRGDATVL